MVVGTKQFEEGKEKSLQIVAKAESNEEEAFNILDKYKEKLDILEVEKNEDFYEYEESIKKANAIYYLIYSSNRDIKITKMKEINLRVDDMRNKLYQSKLSEQTLSDELETSERTNIDLLKRKEANAKERSLIQEKLTEVADIP